MRLIKAFLADQGGTTAVEYGILAAIIGAALIAGFGAFTGAFSDALATIDTSINNAWN